MMGATRVAAVVLVASVVAMVVYGTAFNMPMFTRKYDLECGSCHLVIPKLTEMGMNFRAAGFRMPDDIGAEDKEVNNVSTQMSTRLQTRYDAARTDNAGVKTDKSQFTFHEVTFYPLTGAFARNYSSLFELSIGPEEPVEIENAYVRGDWKAGQGFASARVGIFHPFEGFGASDRPLSLSRPLLQTTSANFNQKTFFTPWGFDESGAEVGYTMNRTSIRATLFNGLTFDEEEKTVHPAQTGAGGNAFAKDPSRPDFHNVDVQLFANQILNSNGGGVSLFYYKGALALPVDNDPVNGYFQNDFYRAAAYGSYPVVSRLILLAGGQTGQDETYTSAGGFGDKSTSQGAFGEADVDLSRNCWLAGRYDWFDPTDKKDDNEIQAITVALNKPFNNGLQFISEYQHRQTKQGTTADKKDDSFQTRLIWIW
jgi:hypothetical protein